MGHDATPDILDPILNWTESDASPSSLCQLILCSWGLTFDDNGVRKKEIWIMSLGNDNYFSNYHAQFTFSFSFYSNPLLP